MTTVQTQDSVRRRPQTRPRAARRHAAARRHRGRATQGSRSRLVDRRRLYGGGGDDTQEIDSPPVGAHDSELQFPHLDGLAAARQTTEFLHEQSADGVVFLVGKCGAEVVVEIRNRREGTDGEFALALPPNRLIVLDIVFIVDLPDDLLNDVLDGHETAYAAVLVHHHGNVIVAQPKFLEQDVEPFAFRDEDHRAHVFAYLERLVAGGLQPQ